MSDRIERFGWSVAEWSEAAGVSRSTVYILLKAGQLQSVTYCRKRIIRTHPAAWLESLALSRETDAG